MRNTTAVLAILWGASVNAKVLDLTKTKNSVEFLAVGKPSALKIRGKLDAGNLAGTCERTDTAFHCQGTVKLDNFDTGISLRNEHMKEKYLETKKFPEAKLVVSPVKPEKEGTFQGKLTLHGIEKEITGKYELSPSGEATKGKLAFSLELEPYGIAVPSYLGITVSKTVDIAVEFQE